MTNKIYGIGLSRTGTMSLTEALKQAGIIIKHFPHNKEQVFDKNQQGASDISIIPFYKKLDKAFPGSKFIYTFREKESWLESIENHLARRIPKTLTSWHRFVRMEVYGCLDFDKNKYSEAYERHDIDVREYFKDRPQDLLIVNVVGGENTESLKQFLNISKDITYPHINRKK